MAQFHLTPNSVQEVLETHDEDVIVTNRDGIIMKATRISGQRYGLEAEDLIGQSVYELEKVGIFSPAITPLVLKQKKKVVTIQQTTSGSKILITGIPFYDFNGEVEYVISYSYEVSELLVIQDYMKEIDYELSKVQEEVHHLRKKMLASTEWIVTSQSTQEAFSTIRQAAPLDVSVVIHGEPGSGRSTLAKELHKESTRSNGPFIEVDCATLPESLFLKELVGEQQEVQGRMVALPGLFAIAEGGTLFLKNIDRMPLHIQTAFLKVIKENRFKPAASDTYRNLDVRLVSSSLNDLKEKVQSGCFLNELYYVLNIVPVGLLPLKDRKEDVSALITRYIDFFSRKYQKKKVLSDAIFAQLLQQEWNGNIQELKHLAERLVVGSMEEMIEVRDLPQEYRMPEEEGTEFNFEGETLPHILEQVEMQVLNRAQQQYKTTTEMAKILGISQPSVVRKLKKYRQPT